MEPEFLELVQNDFPVDAGEVQLLGKDKPEIELLKTLTTEYIKACNDLFNVALTDAYEPKERKIMFEAKEENLNGVVGEYVRLVQKTFDENIRLQKEHNEKIDSLEKEHEIKVKQLIKDRDEEIINLNRKIIELERQINLVKN